MRGTVRGGRVFERDKHRKREIETLRERVTETGKMSGCARRAQRETESLREKGIVRGK